MTPEQIRKEKARLYNILENYSELNGAAIKESIIEKIIAGAQLAAEQSKGEAAEFAHWIQDNFYSRYWGSDEPNNRKWYDRKKPLPPERIFLTDDELFNLYINRKEK